MTPKQTEQFSKLTRIQQAIVTAEIAGTDTHEAYKQAGGKATSGQAVRVAVHRARNNKKVVALMSELKTVAREALDDAIVNRKEALERLSGIVRQRDDDRASMIAIKQLAEMEGWEAVKKTESVVNARHSLDDFYLTTEQKAIIDKALDDFY